MSSVLNQQPASPSKKNTKRKIDDALHNLDQALRTDDVVKQPPVKKARFPGTLYTTLAKYGIKTSKSSATEDSKSGDLNFIKRTAPHLSAILSRAAIKKQKMEAKEEFARVSAINSTLSSDSTPTDFRPSSTTSFLSRLSTFKLSTYSSKPAEVDAVAASKAGWTNEGKERLVCVNCKASWVLAPRDGMSRDAANTLVEKQRSYLISNHKDGCPWKVQQCDDSIYCLPLKAPSVLSKEIKKSALELDSKNAMEGVEIRHPLASTQVQAFLSALSSVQLEEDNLNSNTNPVTESSNVSTDVEGSKSQEQPKTPTQTAALTALFGWSIVPPTDASSELSALSTVRTSSITMPHGPSRRMGWNTISQSASTLGSPTSLSAAVTEIASPSYGSLGALGSPRPSRIPIPRTASATGTRLPRREFAKEKDNTLLFCALCQRRIGLWTFKSGAKEPTDTGASTTSNTNPNNPISLSSALTTANGTTDPENIRAGMSRLPVRRASGVPLPKRQFDLLKEHRSYCPFVVRTTVVPSLSAFMSSMGMASGSPESPSSPVSPSQESSPSTPRRPSFSRRTSSSSTFSFTFSPRNAPAYPSSPANGTGGLGDPAAVEGWRAVLTVVLRTGLGRRQRQRAMMNVKSSIAKGTGLSSDTGTGSSVAATNNTTSSEGSMGDPMELDGVQAMVADVKSRGGRDLLRYVRGLFA